MQTALDKLDGTELNGRRIKLIEDKPRGRSRSRSARGGRSRSRSKNRSRSKTRSRYIYYSYRAELRQLYPPLEFTFFSWDLAYLLSKKRLEGSTLTKCYIRGIRNATLVYRRPKWNLATEFLERTFLMERSICWSTLNNVVVSDPNRLDVVRGRLLFVDHDRLPLVDLGPDRGKTLFSIKME